MKLHVFARLVVTTLAVALLHSTAAAAGPEHGQCRWKGDRASCLPYGCVPVDDAGAPVSNNPDLIPIGAPGLCGPCTNDDQCGGGHCRTPREESPGTCAPYKDSPPPRPFRPRFGLLVVDLSFNVADSTSTRPIVSAGYLGQIALGSVHPAVRPDGKGFIVADTPRFYLEGSASAAFAGPSQNVFVWAGLTYYVYDGPLALTTLSAGLLYQRQGTEIWLPDTAKNRDRFGPGLALGFLQNLYLRGAYVFGMAGPDHHGAAIVSLLYMRDLFDDLVSDRFRKYLPKAMQDSGQ